MRRFTLLLLLVIVAGGATGLLAQSAPAASTLCVGGKPGCYATVQSAVDAAHDGDTIRIAPGTYAGGVTIDVSVDVRGAGAGATTIQGGGPVLTIGAEQADTEPTVAISGVTITGGFNNSFPDRAVTQGGGVRIPQGSFQTRAALGATVTITDSVISNNKVASQQLLAPGFCGPFDCSFASGGGIWSAGTLTLVDTRVTDNQAGDPASITTNAGGGGISEGFQGVLTLRHSFVTGNRVSGTTPWGDAATAAGIDARGRLSIEDSVVSRNSAELSTDDPTDEFPIALAGGIDIAAQAMITRTIVSGNSVTAANVNGQALAVAGGIFVDGSLLLSDSTIDHNQVSSSLPISSQDTALAGAGGIEVNGVATIRRSLLLGNSVAANAPAGVAGSGGGGLSNFGQTSLDRTVITANRVTASGASGFANGGGIENTTLFGSTPSLTVTGGVIAGNTVDAGGLTSQGGGLFTTFPVALTNTVIAGNRPDQCFGC